MSQLMTTGDVCTRMGTIITVERLIEMGFQPVDRVKRAMFWAPADFPAMCEAYGNWIKSRRDVPMPSEAEKAEAKADKKAAAAKKAAPATANKSFDDDEDL
jgi:hypothetical protein